MRVLSDGLGLGGWGVERRVGPGWGPPWVTDSVTLGHTPPLDLSLEVLLRRN